MEQQNYETIVNKHKPKENRLLNALLAFLTGGLIGAFGNFLQEAYSYFLDISKNDAAVLMLTTLIFLACLFTALGFFDSFAKVGKMGLIIPITGFAHSMQSAILDYKKEGLIYGFGANIFRLAGSVILYGVVAAYIFGIIRYAIMGG